MKKRKIKDPEKYIKRLKNEIEKLNDRFSRAKLQIQTSRGDTMIIWSPYEREQTCSGSYGLGRFIPGEKIAIIGRVVRSFAEIDEKCGNKRSGITYKVLETRRMER